MVRIRVVKKSQLIAGAVILLTLVLLTAAALILWQSGLYPDKAGRNRRMNDMDYGYGQSLYAAADGAGMDAACAAALLSSNAGACPSDAGDGRAYVVNVDFGGMAAAQSGAAELSEILEAGLSGRADAMAYDATGDAGALHGRSILIYHTHTHEAYEKLPRDDYEEISAYRTSDQAHSVVRVGRELKEILEGMGAAVCHDTTDYEQDSLPSSYSRSLATLEKFRDDGRAFDLWLDIHRDAYSEKGSGNPFSVKLDGKDAARLMVLLGTGEGRAGGQAFDVKPDFEKNLIWGQRLTDALERIAPGISRPLMVRTGRYNQHISERCLLIEVGHNRNTLEQALNSMPYLARAIAGVLA